MLPNAKLFGWQDSDLCFVREYILVSSSQSNKLKYLVGWELKLWHLVRWREKKDVKCGRGLVRTSSYSKCTIYFNSHIVTATGPLELSMFKNIRCLLVICWQNIVSTLFQAFGNWHSTQIFAAISNFARPIISSALVPSSLLCFVHRCLEPVLGEGI